MLAVLVHVLLHERACVVIAVTRPHVGVPGACNRFNDLEVTFNIPERLLQCGI